MITITEMAEVHAARIAERDAQIASLTRENERLHQAIVDHIEKHDWSWVDPVSRGYPDVDDLRAALQPKEVV